MKDLSRERMTESKDELARMLGEDELRDAVLLVSFHINRQDYHDSGRICAQYALHIYLVEWFRPF